MNRAWLIGFVVACVMAGGSFIALCVNAWRRVDDNRAIIALVLWLLVAAILTIVGQS